MNKPLKLALFYLLKFAPPGKNHPMNPVFLRHVDQRAMQEIRRTIIRRATGALGLSINYAGIWMAWELVLLLVGAAAISTGCLVPARWLPALPNDKLMHFLAYGALALLAGRIAQNGVELAGWLIGLFIVGWLIECLQKWVPGRSFCWRDMAANAAGIVVAAGLSHMVIGI